MNPNLEGTDCECQPTETDAAPKTPLQSSVGSGEWVEELVAALNHVNLAVRYDDEMSAVELFHVRQIQYTLQTIIATGRSRSSNVKLTP